MSISERIEESLAPVVEGLGYEWVGFEFHPNSKNAILRVFIDKENGVNIDDCAQVSHQISGVLDVEDPITSRYTLEVSSPGLDRPLFKLKDYERFAGQMVLVQLVAPINGRKNLKGLLKGIEDQEVVVQIDDEEYLFSIDMVNKARLVPQF